MDDFVLVQDVVNLHDFYLYKDVLQAFPSPMRVLGSVLEKIQDFIMSFNIFTKYKEILEQLIKE